MNLTERWATPEIPLSNTTLRIHLKKIHVAHACVVPLPETDIAPETLGLEDEFPFGQAYFQVLR